ncbi:MAG: 16S rRNA (adenine(1518)-N(6)/adenine(1519)-N(6))-dimethyltransferase RsmA [Planctomycetota bacterium]
MPQTLTEIKQLLATHGLRPKHRLGQNFLHDHNHQQRILAAANPQPTDLLLEVGPGTGTLTVDLLDAGATVIAVEIDTDLQPILEQVTAEHAHRFTLLLGDALAGKHHLNPDLLNALARPQGDAASAASSPPTTFKLIANLPYHIASPLLANLALLSPTEYPTMTTAVVMVQKEVADRLTASPSTKAFGPLGIVLQALYHTTTVSTLPPSCFWPPPSIASAVVRLVRRDEPLTPHPQAFSDFLHTLFSKRRKQLGSILGRGFPFPPAITTTQRPETLTVEQLIELHDAADNPTE